MTFHVISGCARRHQPKLNGNFGGGSTTSARATGRALYPQSVESDALIHAEERLDLVVIGYGIVPAAEDVSFAGSVIKLGVNADEVKLNVSLIVLATVEHVGHLDPLGVNSATSLGGAHSVYVDVVSGS